MFLQSSEYEKGTLMPSLFLKSFLRPVYVFLHQPSHLFYLSVIFLDDCNLKGDPELECSQYVYKTYFFEILRLQHSLR